MDVRHDVTEQDLQPDRAEAALLKRRANEHSETVRVRGPQGPGDQLPKPREEPSEALHLAPVVPAVADAVPVVQHEQTAGVPVEDPHAVGAVRFPRPMRPLGNR